jgi:hypothetical protein
MSIEKRRYRPATLEIGKGSSTVFWAAEGAIIDFYARKVISFALPRVECNEAEGKGRYHSVNTKFWVIKLPLSRGNAED